MGHNSEVQQAIAEVCDDIKELLLRKNEAYGNSALEPSRIFSTSSAIEQINVRIDDKLSRIKTLTENQDLDHNDESLEDTKNDLIGYLILERVAKIVEAKSKKGSKEEQSSLRESSLREKCTSTRTSELIEREV